MKMANILKILAVIFGGCHKIIPLMRGLMKNEFRLKNYQEWNARIYGVFSIDGLPLRVRTSPKMAIAWQ